MLNENEMKEGMGEKEKNEQEESLEEKKVFQKMKKMQVNQKKV